jgi:transcriptional regulator with XRE-family HTH domain
MFRRPKEPPTWKTRNPIPEGFNTAPIIRDAMRMTKITQAEIARKTGRNPNTVKLLRRQRSIQSSILHELSIAIGVDLFRPLSDNLPAEIRSNPDTAIIAALNTDKQALEQQVDELKTQLAQLREDNGYLKKMIDIIAKK